MTNKEKINQMSNEELADEMHQRLVSYYLCEFCYYHHNKTRTLHTHCKEGIQKWLESEVSE